MIFIGRLIYNLTKDKGIKKQDIADPMTKAL